MSNARVIGEDDIGPIFAEGDDPPPDRRDGGPAFPSSYLTPQGPTAYDDNHGMSLRDYFAGQIIQGLATQSIPNVALAARLSYDVADAMLEARKR